MKGYFTIEATLLMPMVLAVYIFLIYLGLYQYDRCLLEQDCRLIALRGSFLQGQENKEIYWCVNKMFNENNWDKFALSVKNNIAIEVSGENVNAEICRYINVPFVKNIFEGISEEWKIQVAAKSRRLEPATVIRICKKIMEVGRDKNGSDNESE